MDSYRPPIGTPIEDLDTPCLLVDMDAFEHNMRLVADTFEDTSCKMRQHAKNIKSPPLAHLQIRAGGTIGGVCAAKVSEAEVMVDGGVHDVLITSQVTSLDKIARICDLTKRADMKVAIDDARNLRDISAVAEEHGTAVGVVIEVDTSMGRGGIRRVEQGVELAGLADQLPGTVFKGVMSHQTLADDPYPDRETRFIEGRRYIQMCLDVKDAIEAAGIPVEIVSSGESWTYDVAPDIPGVTEVEGGTYALMSRPYKYLDEFEIAAKVLATVVSTPRPGVAIGDVGSRALALSKGLLPTLDGVPGVTVDSLQPDHIVLRSEGEMPLRVGDQLLLESGQQDVMVNRWDRFIAVRDGVVETVWDIPGRGCHH